MIAGLIHSVAYSIVAATKLAWDNMGTIGVGKHWEQILAQSIVISSYALLTFNLLKISRSPG